MLEQLFAELLSNRWDEVQSKSQWIKAHFEHIKYLSATDTGILGEEFIEAACKRLSFSKVEHLEKRRGQFDVSINGTTFEVKTASLDKSGSFQFNGIRYDTKYQYLLLFGVAPEALYIKIYPKSELSDITLTPMRKGSNSDFKHTLPPSKMCSIQSLQQEINKAII